MAAQIDLALHHESELLEVVVRQLCRPVLLPARPERRDPEHLREVCVLRQAPETEEVDVDPEHCLVGFRWIRPAEDAGPADLQLSRALRVRHGHQHASAPSPRQDRSVGLVGIEPDRALAVEAVPLGFVVGVQVQNAIRGLHQWWALYHRRPQGLPRPHALPHGRVRIQHVEDDGGQRYLMRLSGAASGDRLRRHRDRADDEALVVRGIQGLVGRRPVSAAALLGPDEVAGRGQPVVVARGEAAGRDHVHVAVVRLVLERPGVEHGLAGRALVQDLLVDARPAEGRARLGPARKEIGRLSVGHRGLLLRNIRVHVDVLPDQHLVADRLGAAAEPASNWRLLLLLLVVANLVLLFILILLVLLVRVAGAAGEPPAALSIIILLFRGVLVHFLPLLELQGVIGA
mmetsp:Transcript_11947/g.35400  ORF Transcript_11947/g.35400 Transcript_11947/m.35400 type:complete len:402 (+) Transcript_11947:4264-5469(+)